MKARLGESFIRTASYWIILATALTVLKNLDLSEIAGGNNDHADTKYSG